MKSVVEELPEESALIEEFLSQGRHKGEDKCAKAWR